MVPKDWLREVKAGATLEVKFGAAGQLPANLEFEQVGAGCWLAPSWPRSAPPRRAEPSACCPPARAPLSP